MQAPSEGTDHEKEDMRTFIYVPSTTKVPNLIMLPKLFSQRVIVIAC